MATTKAEQKRIDNRIAAAYQAVGDGIAINVMNIPKLFDFARPIVIVGVTDEDLQAIVAGWLAIHREN